MQTTTPNTEPETVQSPADSPTDLGASDCYALVYVPQWQEKLGWKLFPSNHIDLPEMPNRKDGLICHVTVQLSWLDRLRMLISGKLDVTAKTATENVIGANVTATGVSVIPPTWLQRHNAGSEPHGQPEKPKGTVRRWTIKQGQRMNGIQVSAKGKDIECGWDHLFRSLRKKLSTPKRTLA